MKYNSEGNNIYTFHILILDVLHAYLFLQLIISFILLNFATII